MAGVRKHRKGKERKELFDSWTRFIDIFLEEMKIY